MKSTILHLLSLCFTVMLQAQVSKTIQVTEGNLYYSLTAEELATVTSLTLTGTIKALDFRTFSIMPSLTELDLSEVKIVRDDGRDGKNVIPSNAFQNGHLKSIKLPLSCDEISDYAFSGCTCLTSVTIPSLVTSIGDYAFQNCYGLTSVTIPLSVTSIGNGAFWGCFGLTSVNVPSSVSSIGYHAFYNCIGLTSVTIPSSVTTIEYGAFWGCTRLTTIVSNSKYPIALRSSSVFGSINKYNCTLYVPSGSIDLCAAADQWKDFVSIVASFIELSTFEINIAFKQGSQATLDIVSNVDWTVTCDQTWLTLSQTSGTEDVMLVFTAEANPTASPRTAIVTVSAIGVNQQTIAVTQEGWLVAVNDLSENQIQLNCYPNPFNSNTTINWQIAKTSKVTLKVLDIVGRTVATLVDEQRPQGKYETQFNAGKLPKGIYFCQLKAGELMQTRKMILLE